MLFDKIAQMYLLFDIKEIIFCTSRPQYTHKIMSVFYFFIILPIQNPHLALKSIGAI